MNFRTLLFLAALAAGLFAVYFPILFTDPLVTFDDDRLILPLKSVSSFSDYKALVDNHEILDVQPLRDLSLWLDVQLEKAVGLPFFRITNLALWIFGLACVLALFDFHQVRRSVSIPLVTLLAFHPLMVNSVAWAAARKHLLASDLILLTTLWALRSVKDWRIPFGYLASLLAQPIFIFWPAWWVTLKRPTVERRTLLVFAATILVGITIGYLNLHHYQAEYLTQNAGRAKFDDGSLPSLFFPLLILGRALVVVLFPYPLKLYFYQPDEAYQYWGLALFGVVTLALWLRWRTGLVWVAFFVMPLLPFILRSTNIFLSDTYLIVPTVAVFLGVGIMINRFRLSYKMAAPFGAGLLLVAITMSYTQAQTWSSTRSFCKAMSESAPNEQCLACYAMILIQEGDSRQAAEIAERLLRDYPAYRGGPDILAKAMLNDHTRTYAEKIARLRAEKQRSVKFAYYFALLHASAGDFKAAMDLLTPVLKSPQLVAFEGADVLEELLADALRICAKSPTAGCEEHVERIKGVPLMRPWDEQRFRTRRALPF